MSSDVSEEVLAEFSARLVAVARRRLDRKTRQKEDPEDIVQSALKSFLRRQQAGKVEITGKESLWTLLVRITQRKCSKRVRDYHRQRRDVGREVSLTPNDSHTAEGGVSREPPPPELAAFAETVQLMVDGFDDREKQIIILRLQSCTQKEISEQVSLSERTVRRVIKRTKTRLKTLIEVDD